MPVGSHALAGNPLPEAFSVDGCLPFTQHPLLFHFVTFRKHCTNTCKNSLPVTVQVRSFKHQEESSTRLPKSRRELRTSTVLVQDLSLRLSSESCPSKVWDLCVFRFEASSSSNFSGFTCRNRQSPKEQAPLRNRKHNALLRRRLLAALMVDLAGSCWHDKQAKERREDTLDGDRSLAGQAILWHCQFEISSKTVSEYCSAYVSKVGHSTK